MSSAPVKSMEPRLWSAKVMVGVGFLMLLLTSLQGWGMVGIIVFWAEGRSDLLDELKRLHNLGLTGDSWPFVVGVL